MEIDEKNAERAVFEQMLRNAAAISALQDVREYLEVNGPWDAYLVDLWVGEFRKWEDAVVGLGGRLAPLERSDGHKRYFVAYRDQNMSTHGARPLFEHYLQLFHNLDAQRG